MRAKENRLILQVQVKKILRDSAAPEEEKGYFWIIKRMSYTCMWSDDKMLVLVCVSRILNDKTGQLMDQKDNCLHATRCHEWKHFWWSSRMSWAQSFCIFVTIFWLWIAHKTPDKALHFCSGTPTCSNKQIISFQTIFDSYTSKEVTQTSSLLYIQYHHVYLVIIK